ncbi:hypothetical protein ACFLX8_01450 [Chloroflexota bacterium]
MEAVKNLLIRFRQSGVLLLIGICLIIYIAFGLVYWQQSVKQKELEEQIAKVSLVVAKPLASKEKLWAEYDEVNRSLAPLADSEAIAMLVSIAEQSGINTSPDSDKLIVPSVAVREEKMGGGNYQVLSFTNIVVQGSYDNVMTFISDLDSGETQETMVLKRVTINRVEVEIEGEEETETETTATLDVDLYTKL